jgi:hypothetical protein
MLLAAHVDSGRSNSFPIHLITVPTAAIIPTAGAALAGEQRTTEKHEKLPQRNRREPAVQHFGSVCIQKQAEIVQDPKEPIKSALMTDRLVIDDVCCFAF